MTAREPRNAMAWRAAPALRAAIHALGKAARTVVASLKSWRRVAADRHTLAGMSDRELFDIGVPRGSVNAVADGRWMRDLPY